MNRLLYSKTQLLVVTHILVSISIYVNVCQEKIVTVCHCRCVHYYRDYLYKSDQNKETSQIILMLHKLKYPCLPSRNIYLVSIGQPQTSNQVQQIQTTIKSMKYSPINVLEISPIPCEVIICVCQGIHNKLHCYTRNHQYAKYRRSLFHRIIIFKDKPLRSYPNTESEDQQHPSNVQIYFGVDRSIL